MKPTTTVAPAAEYEVLAPYYDAFKSVDDYETVASVLTQLVASVADPSGRLLDVGCGTGLSTEAFRATGFDPSGIDSSAAMIERAKARHPEFADRYSVHDIAVPLSVDRPFDLVTCIDDVVHYFFTPEALAMAFQNIAGCVTDTGLLLFDVSGHDHFRDNFTGSYAYDVGETSFSWTGDGVQLEDGVLIGRAELSVTTATRTERVAVTQRHTPIAEIQAALGVAGFAVVGGVEITQDGEVSFDPTGDVAAKRFVLASRSQRIDVGGVIHQMS